MSERKSRTSLDHLERALDRLRDALAVPADAPLAIDGTIQRYEFTIELTWKTLKRALSNEGIETATPREAIVQAFKAHWIDDRSLWISMLKDRNAASHIYDEETARQIYNRIREYYPVMHRAWRTLDERTS